MGETVEGRSQLEGRHELHRKVTYYIDENLSAWIPRCLRHIGYSAARVKSGEPDDLILEEVSRVQGVLITGDRATKTEFTEQIKQAGVSVAWVWANHADPATQYFAVFTFVYRLNSTLRDATGPLYFDVGLSSRAGFPDVRITPTGLP